MMILICIAKISFSFLKINFNWRKIALQCCVGFCHTIAQLSHNHAHVTLPPSSVSKESTCNAGDPGLIPVSGRSPEKEMATHSRILAWRVPWTEATVQGLPESDTTY